MRCVEDPTNVEVRVREVLAQRLAQGSEHLAMWESSLPETERTLAAL